MPTGLEIDELDAIQEIALQVKTIAVELHNLNTTLNKILDAYTR